MNYFNDDVINIMLNYAINDNNIRAVLLEGSRAYGKVDKYSDYDIVYVTKMNAPYLNGAILPFLTETFGEIAVMQTPDNGDVNDVYTHLIQFTKGVRIDLTFNSLEYLKRVPLESATAVLLDKDENFKNAATPSDEDFWLVKPGEEDFRGHCNEFWWVSPYVAKALARNQVLHALEIFSEIIRKEYRIMLEYLAGCRNNWKCVNTGKHSTNISYLLLPDDTHYYDALIRSYVQADKEQIRNAIELLMTKYNSLASMVAEILNYEYDFGQAERTMRFINSEY